MQDEKKRSKAAAGLAHLARNGLELGGELAVLILKALKVAREEKRVGTRPASQAAKHNRSLPLRTCALSWCA